MNRMCMTVWGDLGETVDFDWRICEKKSRMPIADRLWMNCLRMSLQLSRYMLRGKITEILGFHKLCARWVPKQLTEQHELNQTRPTSRSNCWTLSDAIFQTAPRNPRTWRLQITVCSLLWRCTWMEKNLRLTRSWRGRTSRQVDQGGGGRHRKINPPAHRLHREGWRLRGNITYLRGATIK